MLVDGWRTAGPLSAWLGLSALIAAIQIISSSSESPFDTFRQFHFFVGGFLAIPLASCAFPALRSSTIRLWVGAGVSALLFALLILGYSRSVQGSSGSEVLVWWPFIYRNHYATFILLVTPALLWQSLTDENIRWCALCGVAAGAAGVISSGSRSGAVLLAFTVTSTLVIWALRTNRRRWFWGLGLAGIMVAASLALTNSNMLIWRLRNAGHVLDGRVDYWQATIHMAIEHPLLGWGFGTWPDVYTQFLTKDNGLLVNHAHSDWLEYLAEGGVLPFLALAVLFGRSLWLGLRYPWSLGVSALLLFAMVDYPLRLPILLLALVCLYVWTEAAEASVTAVKPARGARGRGRFFSRSHFADGQSPA